MRFLRPKDKDREKTASAVEKTRSTWFGRVAGVFSRGQLDDETWDELEELLIGADVGVGPTQRLLERLKERVREERTSRPEDAVEILKQEMVDILTVDDGGSSLAVDQPPLVLLIVGVNGAGKTTSIAKIARWYQESDKRVLLAAADTFRAAAIDQLQAWGERLGIGVIAHQPGSDPAAVAFDSLQAARSRRMDVVIVDTAGRLHTKVNLMEEIKKIQRVLSRQDAAVSQTVLLTLDATTGQNGLHQARSFTEALSCDGVVLAKLDGTAKGGVVLSVADELRLPVLFIGTGEQPEDLALFDPREFVDALFAS